MGSFDPCTNLVERVTQLAQATLTDPRFEHCPVTKDELRSLTIEISVLTQPIRTPDPTSLVKGRHGILIRHGGRSGCFLPKVAVDRGWQVEEFLSHCCTMKAGLAPDAWQDPACEVYTFEVESFAEVPVTLEKDA